MKIDMIIVCEPQCVGFEHSEFNAAFLVMLKSAYPTFEIIFMADSSHIEYVKNKLQDQIAVSYREMAVPPRNYSSLRRTREDLLICKSVLQLASKYNIKRVFFSSITTPALLSLKWYLNKFTQMNCIIVIHGILETIKKIPICKPWKLLFWFKFALILPSNKKINYLLLGESIKKNLTLILPEIGEATNSIDHPYLYLEPYNHVFSGEVIRFASLGVAHRRKGTDQFFKVAEKCSSIAMCTNAEFIVIGHIVDPVLKSSENRFVQIPSPDIPLEREDFDKFVKGIDYVVFCYPTSSYQLTASGALFDAFSHLKPIIAIRNQFFEYYFNKMGDIGYLCDDDSEMINIIEHIINHPDNDKYQRQRNNMLRGRKLMMPEQLGKQMRDIFK